MFGFPPHSHLLSSLFLVILCPQNMDNRCMGCGSNRYKSQRALTVHQKKCEGYKDLRREADAMRRANAMKRANAEKLENERALKR